MADLQSFLNAVPTAQSAGPRNSAGGGAQLLQAASGLLQNSQRIGQIEEDRAEKQTKLNEKGAVSEAYIDAEDFKRREPLREALEAGHLSSEQAGMFGVDEADSLKALNQASAKGMSHSVRNALERSVRFQMAARNNPGAAKELAAAYGIGKTGVEQDTLDSLERVEREQLEADADEVRKLAAAEGYTEFFDKSNEEVLEMWVDSPAAVRNRRIQQNERAALDQTSDIAARATDASKAISLAYANVGRNLDRVQSQYAETRGTLNTGTDGSTLSLAEELNLAGEALISEIKRTYADFPKQTEAYANGVRTSISQRLSSRTTGLATGASEYKAQVLRPMELEQKKLAIENSIMENTNNSQRALENRIELDGRIFRAKQDMLKLQGEVLADRGAMSGLLKQFVEDPYFVERQALYLAAGEESNLLVEELLNAPQANAKKIVNQAIVNLSVLANTGVAADQGMFKKAIADLELVYNHNAIVTPSKNKILEESMLQLAHDPAFMKQAQGSPAVRKLLKPYSEGIKSRIIQSLQKTNNLINTDRVMTTGMGGLPWKKLGEYTVVDQAATNKYGVPQLKLATGTEEQLSTEDRVRYGAHLDKYNQGLQLTQSPKEYELLKVMSGATSTAQALDWVIGTADGISLEALNSQREVQDNRPTVTAQDVQDSLIGVQ